MNSYEFEKTINALVDKRPTEVYKRIHHLWPNSLAKYAPGYEQVDSSKSTMKKYLINKGNTMGFDALIAVL